MAEKRRRSSEERKKTWDALVGSLLEAPLAQDMREFALLELGFAAAMEGWHYLEMLSIAAAEVEHNPDTPWLYDSRPTVRAMLWSLNLRLNTAFEADNAKGSVSGKRHLDLPARGPFDRWLHRITGATLVDLLEATAILGSLIPLRRRAKWIRRELMRRCGRLDGNLRRGAFDGIYHHHIANDTSRWRRNARACPVLAVHVRLHFGTGHMIGKVIVGGQTQLSTSWLLPNTSRLDLFWPRRNPFGYHHAARSISYLVYNTLLLLNDPQSREKCIEELRAFYDWTLRPLFEHPRITRAIAGLGDRPTLCITTHGALTQIPFAAVRDDIGYLAERFDVIQAAPLPMNRGERRLMLDDDSVSGGSPMPASFPVRVLADTRALPEACHEVAHYSNLAGAVSGVETFDAESFWSAERLGWLFGGSGIGILSSHMEASADRVDKTIVVSPNGDRLSIADGLPDRCELSLAVLAACRSAAPLDWFGIESGGIVTLLRMSNVKSVVSTLWDVDDLAARLYNEKLLDCLAAGATRARAHGDAMRHVMNSALTRNQSILGPRGAGPIRDQDFHAYRLDHPNYWSTFVLCGAWL